MRCVLPTLVRVGNTQDTHVERAASKFSKNLKGSYRYNYIPYNKIKRRFGLIRPADGTINGTYRTTPCKFSYRYKKDRS